MGEGDEGGVVIDLILYQGRKGGLGYRLQPDEQAGSGKEKFSHAVVDFLELFVGDQGE